MKKLSIYIFILSVLILPVLAADANIYEAQDFTKHPEQMAVLAERDLVRINWEGKEHQIHVRQIYLNKTKVDLTAFIEGSEVPFYATIDPKHSLQLDFDRNDIFDMKVSLFNILEENGKKFVALKFEKLAQEPNTITAEAVTKPKNSLYQFVSKKILYLSAGVVVFLLGLVIWKKTSHKKT